jgi:hypothetical protein
MILLVIFQISSEFVRELTKDSGFLVWIYLLLIQQVNLLQQQYYSVH